MVAYFQLQPAEAELQELAEEYWKKAGEKVQELEKAAFEAGEGIRNGDFTLANLEAIVRWKSERSVQYLIANSNEKIRRVLAAVTAPGATTESAVKSLLESARELTCRWPRPFWRRFILSDTRCSITARSRPWAMRGTTSASTRSTWPSASDWPRATSCSRRANCLAPRRCARSTAHCGSGRAATLADARGGSNSPASRLPEGVLYSSGL